MPLVILIVITHQSSTQSENFLFYKFFPESASTSSTDSICDDLVLTREKVDIRCSMTKTQKIMQH